MGAYGTEAWGTRRHAGLDLAAAAHQPNISQCGEVDNRQVSSCSAAHESALTMKLPSQPGSIWAADQATHGCVALFGRLGGVGQQRQPALHTLGSLAPACKGVRSTERF